MKNALRLIENLISSGVEVNPSEPDTLKIRFLNIVGFLGFGIFFSYGLINLYIGDYIPAILELITAVIIIITLIGLRITKNINIASIVSVFIIAVFSIYNFIFGGFSNTGFLWIYAFPPLAYFLNGRKNGTLFMLFLLTGIIFSTMLSILGVIDIPYDLFTIQMFVTTLAVSTLFIINYEVIQEQITNRLQRNIEIVESSSEKATKSLMEKESIEKKFKETIEKLEERNKDLEKQKKAMINLIEDIEEERKISMERAESLKQFKEAVDNAQQHIIFTDTKGTILYANDAVETITGYSKEEVIGKKPSVWGGNMSKEFYETLWSNIKDNKKIFEGEVTNKKKSGELYIAHIQIIPILDNEKRVKFFVGLQRDITRQKEIDKSKNEFVSIASHQLRTPLNAIRWLTEILLREQQGELNDKQKELLNDLNQTNNRMIALVGDLLDVSRIETNRNFEIIKNKYDINELVSNLLEEYKSPQYNTHFEIINKIPEGLTLNIDRVKITQVLRNLIDNSIKYSKENVHIEIGVSNETKEQITIYIKDNGMGISDSDKRNIFNKFFRGSNAQQVNTTGSGLGLYIVKKIIEAHGGEVSFESEYGKGTTFFLTFNKA